MKWNQEVIKLDSLNPTSLIVLQPILTVNLMKMNFPDYLYKFRLNIMFLFTTSSMEIA